MVPKLTPRRWLLIVSVVWALVLVGAVVWSIRRGAPTAREQTTIAAAQTAVDRAVAEVDAVAAGPRTVVTIGPYVEIGRCNVTAVRSGARYQRIAYVYTPVGDEEELLGRVASALPEGYRARVSREATPKLTADAGDYVALTGAIPAAGQVRFVADTGCRSVGGPIDAAEPASTGANRGPVETVMATLGARASEWHTYRVPCPSGGSLWTVEGQSDSKPGPLDVALRDSVGDAAILGLPDTYAFRSGPVGLTVRTDSGRLVVTATTDCQ